MEFEHIAVTAGEPRQKVAFFCGMLKFLLYLSTMSESYLPCNHPPCYPPTHILLIRLLLYVPDVFSVVLSLTAFCTFRCLRYTSWHWCHAKFFDEMWQFFFLTRKKEMAFRMRPIWFVVVFYTVWRAANENWVHLIKAGDISPSDCFPRSAILRMLKWREPREVGRGVFIQASWFTLAHLAALVHDRSWNRFIALKHFH